VRRPRLAARGPGERHLVDLAFDAMFVRGFHDRLITYWNPGAERLYGWNSREAIGRRARDLLGSEYPVPLEQIEDELRQTGRWEGEIHQRRKDGSPIVVAARWGLQTDAAGEPQAILEINSDLTAEREAGAERRLTEQVMSLMVNSVVDYAIFMLDPDGRVASWNEGAHQIKGYSADEIIGQHFSVFYPPGDVAAGKPDRELAEAKQTGRYSEEGWRVRKDGTRFWASVLITALRDDSGRLRGFGKVTRDVTERRKQDERQSRQRAREARQLRAHADRMAELERSKTEFLNLASHELRGPLTVVRGYTSMMEDGTIPPEHVPQVARLLGGKLAQMELLIQQMLETARLEHDRIELRRERFDLRAVAAEQMDTFRPLASGHRLVVAGGRRPLLVKADRLRIATIIANLVDNAIKYSPNGGEVRCTVGSRDGYAFVSVRDEGLGIAEEHMPRLFSRFGRLPTEANVSISGTGLGLFLSREIARRHGGDITVESACHRGSEFTLTVPIATRRRRKASDAADSEMLRSA
jgi:PAS domain S-box-containing protein